MNLSFLPALNAALNGGAVVLLILALIFIKQGNIKAHRNTMIAAVIVSCLFLVSYVTHQAWRVHEHGGAHTKFYGPYAVRIFYYVMLFTHIVLAMTVPFFAGVLLYLGLKRKDKLHKRIAHFGWPIWMYVSVTGVLIYFMLYHFNSPPPGT